MKHSIWNLAAFLSVALAGCGPAVIATTTMMGLNQEERCLKLEGELRERKLSDYQIRKEMIEGSCRNYYEKFVKK